MKKLTNKEEEVMIILWELKTAFVKDVIAELPEPKPHYNTISSLIRLLQERGFIGFTAYGNTYEYYPIISREEYRKTFMKRILTDYFDNSYKNAVSYFVKEQNLSNDELEELINLIKNKE